jgi:SSS family solute:Na+ symporter
MNVALGIIFGWLAITTAVGIAAGLGRRRRLDDRQARDEFLVGGRTFGAVLLYVMMAAEIYSAYAFLGLAGWAYDPGAPIYYGLAYGSIAYAIYFFLGPRINRLGKRLGYLTQPDFMADRYDSRGLGVLTAAMGIIATLIYLELQILGAGIIVEIASNGVVRAWQARVIAFGLIVVFVSTSGIRGVGWTNLLQAAIMLVGMVAAGLVITHTFFGGIAPMFARLREVSPGHLDLAGVDGSYGVTWYTSAVLMSAIGFWMWPHIFQATYTARSERIVRRNACVLPLYQLALLPVILVGFSCFLVLKDQGVSIPHKDQAMMVTLSRFFPSWFTGAVAAGGLAAAVSTSSALILSTATLVARNVFQQGLRPAASDRAVTWTARGAILPITLAAVVMSFYLPDSLVDLILLGYSLPLQLAPALLLGIFWPRVRREAVWVGLIAALAVLIWMVATRQESPWGIHFGFWAFLPNLAIVGVWSALRPADRRTVQRFGPVLWPGADPGDHRPRP